MGFPDFHKKNQNKQSERNDRKEESFKSMAILLCVNNVDVVMLYAFLALMHTNTMQNITHPHRWMPLAKRYETERLHSKSEESISIDGDGEHWAQLSVHAKWTRHLHSDCRVYRYKF